jgi:hypothetical protein
MLGREERFLSARADPFAGSEWEENSRPAPFGMTVLAGWLRIGAEGA